MTMTLAPAVALDDLTMDAEGAGITGPSILCHRNFPADQITEVKVVLARKWYKKGEEDLRGDDLTTHLLTQGFELMSMSIVLTGTVVGPGVEHDVMFVLVKPTD